jgi:hypothetical protein
MNRETGLYLLVLGGIVVVVGAFIYLFHDKVHWIGRLPGDIRIERENFRVYIPITTMLLFSGVLSLVLYVIRKLM